MSFWVPLRKKVIQVWNNTRVCKWQSFCLFNQSLLFFPFNLTILYGETLETYVGSHMLFSFLWSETQLVWLVAQEQEKETECSTMLANYFFVSHVSLNKSQVLCLMTDKSNSIGISLAVIKILNRAAQDSWQAFCWCPFLAWQSWGGHGTR